MPAGVRRRRSVAVQSGGTGASKRMRNALSSAGRLAEGDRSRDRARLLRAADHERAIVEHEILLEHRDLAPVASVIE